MKYYIIAGEASGDQHGAKLMKELKRQDPEADIRFWGGDAMTLQGGTRVKHIKELGFMGFVEVLKHLSQINANMRLCKHDIEEFKPDAIIYIDFPGFNLRIARWAHRKGYRNYHYISPQVWAWKKGRIRQMRKNLDRLFCILPFEEDFYRRNNFEKAEYVGHPLLDAEETQSQERKGNQIALLPGSRHQEISRLLPQMVRLANRHPEYHFVVAGVSHLGHAAYDRHIAGVPNISVEYDHTQTILATSRAAVVCSGTATLETALADTPQVVCYRANALSIAIARRLVGNRVKYISLVNLIADEPIVKELLQNDCNDEAVEQQFRLITEDEDYRRQQREGYSRMRQIMGGSGASKKVAETVIATIGQTQSCHRVATEQPLAKTIALILVMMLPLAASADKVKVRLFSTNTISAVNVSFDLGAYALFVDDTVMLEPQLAEDLAVEMKPHGGKVTLTVNDYSYGAYKKVSLIATDTACILCINPAGVKQRTYEGSLHVTSTNQNSLMLINEVEFETYIAGVVQSEIYGDKTDIFRVQAIISRTWALRNINKHKKEGYNFCDHVHCQAYHNRCVRPDIMLGTMQSSGETITDANGNLIETPFHSNSGGETANSEDVWRSALPYLRSVPDTFSYRMKQTNWTKTMTESAWLGYFAKTHKLNTADTAIRRQLLNFKQEHRKARIAGIPLTRVRVDLKLKSTYFSVIYDSTAKKVTLDGHGYGHGVGLSQEGTIRMVELGIPYDSIIHHYYLGSKLHHDPDSPKNYVENYVRQISQIIEDDKNRKTQVKSKKDDWLGRLFRIRDREEREEVYDESKQDNATDWQYKFTDNEDNSKQETKQ
ncbi:MAG: lipid-A-disaccharide synthase [Bacteroidales bacterium]|nr:lipid-A-disaccharide synthase [Bacteroidales bacterium]